ncbi:MAG: hypothetical protein GQ574_07820 [Crocinitomix sp.]|nr:hypothetical protein [Crocinitomix sp.]
MKLKTIITFTLILVSVVSCKKNRNEKRFVGAYTGNWEYFEQKYEIEDSSLVLYTIRDTVVGEFTVVRNEAAAILNGGTASVELSEIKYNEWFSSPANPGGMYEGSSDPTTYWWVKFYKGDSLYWTNGTNSGGPYATVKRYTFNGIKIN